MINFAAIASLVEFCIEPIVTHEEEKWTNYFGETP
jgi:hypothetical protein